LFFHQKLEDNIKLNKKDLIEYIEKLNFETFVIDIERTCKKPKIGYEVSLFGSSKITIDCYLTENLQINIRSKRDFFLYLENIK